MTFFLPDQTVYVGEYHLIKIIYVNIRFYNVPANDINREHIEIVMKPFLIIFAFRI